MQEQRQGAAGRLKAWWAGAAGATRMGAIAGAILLVCAGCGAASTSTVTQHTPSPSATAKKATPTPKPLDAAVIGGTVAAFTARYGQYGQALGGNGDSWWTDASQTVSVSVTVSGGTVNQVTVLQIAGTWDATQTLAACTPFLPSGASLFNTSGQWMDYHTSIGEVVMEDPGGGNCVLSMATS